MYEYALLLLLGAIAVAWFNNRKAQEIAVARCRHACKNAGLQFLDDVAPISRFKLVRDDGGTLRLQRRYSFDYTTAQGERRSGSLVMLGRKPVALQIEGRTVFETDDRRP
jgi:hypothetical protein